MGKYKSMQKDALCNRSAIALILGDGMNWFLTTSTEGRSGYAAKRLSVVAKTLRVMQLTAILITVCCLSVTARTVSQTVTFKGKDIGLKTIFKTIENQTGYFILFDEEIINKEQVSNIDAKDMPLKDFLAKIMEEQPFSYSLLNTTISIKLEEEKDN